jgi:O-succinylbenzoic acid--CoA ligase
LKINTKNIDSVYYLDELNRFKDNWFSEDPIIKVQTSGSTGDPKTISLSKEHMKSSALATLSYLKINPGSKALLCLPISKIGGIMMFVRAVVADLDLWVISPSSSPLEHVEAKECFDFCAMVPLQISNSLNDLDRAGKIIAGGGPLSLELIEQIKATKSTLWHSYGMTETISHIALRQISPKLSPSFEILRGVYLEVNKQNCLKIDAPNIGVKNLQTNDIVELISERRFLWKGRLDNVVLSGGLKFYPEDLEQKINLEQNFILAGVDNAILGQQLILIVESKTMLSESNLEKCLKNLARLEKPKEVRYLDCFVYTPNGKIKRKETLRKTVSLRPNKSDT